MSAREEAERLLAEHAVVWLHDNGSLRCRCGDVLPGYGAHRSHVAQLLDETGLLAEDASEGCDCAKLCEMGPTCPGGMLAGLPGAGCGRSGADAVVVDRAAFQAAADAACGVTSDGRCDG